jgi:hypothetical protein
LGHHFSTIVQVSLEWSEAMSLFIERSARALVSLIILALLQTTSACAQAPVAETGSGPISATEYSKILNRIELDLLEWDAVLDKVDPGKGDPAYSVAKQVDSDKNIALVEVSNLRAYIGRERVKRTVYGELALGQFISTLSEQFYQLAAQGALNDLSVEKVSSLVGEIGSLQKRLMEDGMDRVKKFETANCRTAVD